MTVHWMVSSLLCTRCPCARHAAPRWYQRAACLALAYRLQYDDIMAERVQQADRHGEVLRYVGSYDAESGVCQVRGGHRPPHTRAALKRPAAGVPAGG